MWTSLLRDLLYGPCCVLGVFGYWSGVFRGATGILRGLRGIVRGGSEWIWGREGVGEGRERGCTSGGGGPR